MQHMKQSLKKNSYFLWPFKGFGYFISHPSLWWLSLLATLILTILLIGIFIFVMIMTWPKLDVNFWIKLWEILKSFGYSTAALLVGFIVLMPAVITLVLDKMLRKILIMEKEDIAEVSFFKSFYSGAVIFLRTLFWRIFWPVVGVICAVFLGPIGAFISQVGIGHLAVIDGVDLTLALKGLRTADRLLLYKKKRGKIFVVGFFAAILSICLSVTVIGWLLWVPSIFAGVSLWVCEWSEVRKQAHADA